MTITLVFVILICLSYCEFSVESHDDIVECVFAINVNSSIVVSQQSICIPIYKQIVQNVGKVDVRISISKRVLGPREKKEFIFPIRISNINRYDKNRAIVYVSNCDKNNEYYIENPDEGYDRIKILKEAFALGVKHIPNPNYQNVEELISAFSLDDEENVWEKIYSVIKDLLDVNTQQVVSTFLKDDIESIKQKMMTLNNSLTKSDFDQKYYDVIKNLGDIEEHFKVNNRIFNLYLIPLYSNIVTLKMYLYNIGLDIHTRYSEMYIKICVCVYKQYEFSFYNTDRIGKIALEEIYNTVYAGALYNVMMTARSHFAWHILEILPKWFAVLSKCGDDFKMRNDLYALHPISYSDLYGRTTPDLLQQATNVQYSPLVAGYMENNGSLMHLEYICVYIIKSEEQETVYGLGLEFFSHGNNTMPYSTCFGTCIIGKGNNISSEPLYLFREKIITLKVYKSKYIRCLEFSLSNNSIKRFGNHCEDNSTNVEFQLQGHYINSLYLANDYPETKKYFDNVAVSFLPN